MGSPQANTKKLRNKGTKKLRNNNIKIILVLMFLSFYVFMLFSARLRRAVEERCVLVEGQGVSQAGRYTSANVGMSNELGT